MSEQDLVVVVQLVKALGEFNQHPDSYSEEKELVNALDDFLRAARQKTPKARAASLLRELPDHDSERVREFAELTARAVSGVNNLDVPGLHKRIDAQTECISGLNALVEKLTRQRGILGMQLANLKRLLDDHDDSPKRHGEFSGCGREYPATRDNAQAILEEIFGKDPDYGLLP